MTSSNTSTSRLLTIDDWNRGDHSYLSDSDECFYLGDYTAGAGFGHSPVNNWISNLKKSVALRKTRQFEYRHKIRSMREIAAKLRAAMNPISPDIVFVPVPPSKSRDDQLYDDRMVRILEFIGGLNIRDMVVQTVSEEPEHSSVGSRLAPRERADLYAVDESLISPIPPGVVIFDDVLTTGAHFKAVEMVLRPHFPDARFGGLFVARRVPSSDDDLEWD